MNAEPPRSPAVLLVDDEPAWLQGLEMTLRAAGLARVVGCSDPRRVLDLIRAEDVGVVTLDLSMPYVPGEILLDDIAAAHPDLPVIVISGQQEIETAVRCIKRGAFDYFVKSEQKDRLVAAVRRALELRELRRVHDSLRDRFLGGGVRRPEVFSHIVTLDPRLHAAFQYIEVVAPGSEPVLITGESGTGKELVAHALHAASGRTGAFVAVNVAGLDDHLLSDTLFGHRKGAFTGAAEARAGLVERAAGGTLFLDEIGDLVAGGQVKLLRLLQEHEYYPVGADVPRRSSARVVTASNRDLGGLQAAGMFRPDLYYRLRTHHIQLPPLRERDRDLPLLIHHFLAEAAEQLQTEMPCDASEIEAVVAGYPFPGNVRELRALIFDLVSRHKSGQPGLAYLRTQLPGAGGAGSSGGHDDDGDGDGGGGGSRIAFGERLPTLKEATERLIAEALHRAGGSRATAAAMLGITRQALHWRLKHGAREDG